MIHVLVSTKKYVSYLRHIREHTYVHMHYKLHQTFQTYTFLPEYRTFLYQRWRSHGENDVRYIYVMCDVRILFLDPICDYHSMKVRCWQLTVSCNTFSGHLNMETDHLSFDCLVVFAWPVYKICWLYLRLTN